MNVIRKALLLPLSPDDTLLLQDRRGFKPPPWGFFGGGVEAHESPLEAVIRETKEELDVTISRPELEYRGEFPGTKRKDVIYKNYVFLWRFDGDLQTVTLLEGTGMQLFSYAKAYDMLSLEPDKNIVQKCLLQ